MTGFYSDEADLLVAVPKQFPRNLGRVKRLRNTIDMSKKTILSGDTITLLPIPIGSVFAFGVLNGPTLGSSTIAISDGTNDYFAAATFTGAVATVFGKTGPEGIAPSTTDLTPVVTVATANMPTSGILTIDIYYSQST